MNTATFSESWYRIANQCLSLRAQVGVHRQFFRGEKWYVLSDPFNNQFYRLRPAAYDFISRLHPRRTVQSVWEECLTHYPDDAPGQEEAIRLLAQLYQANLLHTQLAVDTEQLFERYRKRKSKEAKNWLLSIMFVRIPLLDPDDFLKLTMPFMRLFLGWFGGLVWVTTVVLAVKTGIDHFPSLKDQTQAVLAPGNLFLLYLGMVIIKTIHEFGHAYICRYFGGEVHNMGVTLLVFTPIPYIDASASWALRNRWQRIFVAAGGMYFEIFVAALALFVWAYTGPGTLHSLAYNIIFIASVSTVVFNANPLLRFDGYYILSDLIDIPNLQNHSRKQMVHLIEHYIFGCKNSHSPANTTLESIMLVIFGILSGIYRVVVFGGIILLIADKFLIVGLILAAVCCIAWVLVPLIKLINYLITSPQLDRVRLRAILVVMISVGGVFYFLASVPFPNRFRATGIVEAKNHPYVINETAGYLTEIITPDGRFVERGQILARLEDSELLLEYRQVELKRRETNLMLLQSLSKQAIDLDPIRFRLQVLDQQLEKLRVQIDSLTLRAPHAGQWIAPRLKDLHHMWLPRGAALGQIIDPVEFDFNAIVRQDDASRLFENDISKAEVRLHGQAATALPAEQTQLVAAAQKILPSAALGWGGGGDVMIDTTDPSGRRAAEAFYALTLDIPNDRGVRLFHGCAGTIRFDLPPEPLMQQWWRKSRQFLQRRYQI